MMRSAVLLDTSFFIRFLDENDRLFTNADGYFRYFLENDIIMMVSTISIAEYCAHGNINELPLRNLRIVPFNLDHGKRAGEFAGFIFKHRGRLQINARNIIPNDTKLFAQADTEPAVLYYLSSDTDSQKIFKLLKEYTPLKFRFLDLHQPHAEAFGILGF